MNFKWLPFSSINDLFGRTQKKLTIQYSAVFMAFLTLFIVIVYYFVRTVVTLEQERLLLSSTELTVETLKTSLQDNVLTQEEVEVVYALQESGGQSFSILVDPVGNVLLGNVYNPRLQPELIKLLRGWEPTDHNEIKYHTLVLSPPSRQGKGFDHIRPSKIREVQFMTTGQAISKGNRVVAFLYTGKDISFIRELIHRLSLILIILGILFLGVAIYLSHLMSKRAMIPIKRSFERQREFVADASHELRTPLSILHSSLDVIEMEASDSSSNFFRKVTSDMRDEVKRMTSLVGDLLTLARSDSGEPNLHLENFDFAATVNQVIRTFTPLAEVKQITIKASVPEIAIIKGDPERLKQLVYILIDNALKYSPDGGKITLSLQTEIIEKKPSVVLTVQDTGIGIPEEHQAHIFKRFYRVDKSRTRHLGGTGLGLSIAHWIVNAHLGTITVKSTPGQGSTFTVQFPTKA